MGNLIGEPFLKYVNEQIELRQSVYGSGLLQQERSPEYIAYLNARTSWVKLASSVIINPEFTQQEVDQGLAQTRYNVATGAQGKKYNSGVEKLKGIGFTAGQAREFVGNALARKAVLFNGMQGLDANATNIDIDGDGVADMVDPTVSGKFLAYKRRRGYSLNNSIYESFKNDANYGLGGTEFGLLPMPGIIDWKVDYKNRGSLRTGTVTIKAYNRFQFELIDLLYLRLGFTMMLEWGNSHYLPNDPKSGKIAEVGNTIIENDWFSYQDKAVKGTNSQVGMLNKIEEYRELYDGNYDGFFGRVTNFDWKYQNDGSYDITLKLMSLGDIIESLRMNIGGAPKDSSGASDDSDKTNAIDLKLNSLRADPDIFNATSNAPYISMVPEALAASSRGVEDYAEKIEKYGYFWKFSDFLDYIATDIIPSIEGSGDAFKKLEIDIEKDKNIMPCYPNQFSVDPRVCIVKNSSGQSLQFSSQGTANWYKKMEQWNSTSGGGLHAKIMNIYINFDFISTIVEQNSDNAGNIDFYTFFDSLCQGINRALGGINKLGCHLRDEVFITFRDENTIGGNGQLVKFLNPNVAADSAEFQIFGYNKDSVNLKTGDSGSSNFVKDVSFETKIDSSLSNMMSISATANGGSTPTAFSQWNDGLTDKYYQIELDPVDTYKVTPQSATTTGSYGQTQLSAAAIAAINNQNQALIEDKFQHYVTEAFGTIATTFKVKKVLLTKRNAEILLGITTGTLDIIEQSVFYPRYIQFDNEFISKGLGILKDKLDVYASGHWEQTGTSTGAVGFIPLTLSLTIDGLSGIKIYQKLNVDTAFLPSIYTDNLSFTIMKVGHTIQNGEWLTKLDGISQPIIAPLTNPQVTAVTYSGATQGSSTVVQSSIRPPIGIVFHPPVIPPSQGESGDTLVIRNDSGGYGYFGASRQRSSGPGIHAGIDITSSVDDIIYAPITGKMKKWREGKMNGFRIEGKNDTVNGIDYTGYTTICGYNNLITGFSYGDEVQKGDAVAKQANLHSNSTSANWGANQTRAGNYGSNVGQHVHFAIEWDSTGNGRFDTDIDPTIADYDPSVTFISSRGGIQTIQPRTDQEIWEYYKAVWAQYAKTARDQEVYKRFNTYATDIGTDQYGRKVIALKRETYRNQYSSDGRRKVSRDFFSYVNFRNQIAMGDLVFDQFQFDNNGTISNPNDSVLILKNTAVGAGIASSNLEATMRHDASGTGQFKFTDQAGNEKTVPFESEVLYLYATTAYIAGGTARTQIDSPGARTIKTIMDSLRAAFDAGKDPKKWISTVSPEDGTESFNGFYLLYKNNVFSGDSVIEDFMEDEWLKDFGKNY